MLYSSTIFIISDEPIILKSISCLIYFFIYIEIKNSFAHTLDVDNLGSLNYSTKGKKRGLGLFSILRDNEASLKVNVVNNYFISLISARKQK